VGERVRARPLFFPPEILSFDDVLELLDEEMTSLVRLVAREQAREVERRP
jgi:hypothetical protein